MSLQDAPCGEGASEQLRTLKRPIDAPPRPVSAPVAQPATPETPAPPGPPPLAPVTPVTPLFDCYTHEGKRYESDTGVGETRWVPLWVIGMDPRAPARTFVRTGATPSPPRAGPYVPSRVPGPSSLGPGAWVQDACYLLAPAEACARRRTQLADVRRERKDAQESARVTLRARADVLSAQLASECP